MKSRYLISGLVLSVALHLLLFVWSPQPGKAAQQAESKPEPVQILVKGAPAAEESTTVTAPPAAAERKAAPPAWRRRCPHGPGTSPRPWATYWSLSGSRRTGYRR